MAKPPEPLPTQKIRDARPDAMADPPNEWDDVDQASDGQSPHEET